MSRLVEPQKFNQGNLLEFYKIFERLAKRATRTSLAIFRTFHQWGYSGKNKIVNIRTHHDLDHSKNLKAIIENDELLISSSGLFDKYYYIKNNIDLNVLPMRDLLTHFTIFGGFEGRSPSDEFDSKFYLEAYPDVVADLAPGV